MKAFGIEVKKQDVRDLYAEMGKDIKQGLNFSEFLGVMTAKMVNIKGYVGAEGFQGGDIQNIQTF
jgi:Ca2+-binding EF-hand superfamily protein